MKDNSGYSCSGISCGNTFYFIFASAGIFLYIPEPVGYDVNSISLSYK